MKRFAYKIAFLFLLLPAMAQAQFTLQGTIEYEKKTNIHRQFEDMEENSWVAAVKAQLPKFASSYFNLYFTQAKSLYKPGKEVESPFKMFGGGAPATDNIVATDFKQERVVAQKQIFEQKFLIEDSTRKLKWKILNEVRPIANYQCRKAVAVMFDSVYVVAFYAEDIIASGGPEMFGGLPGMILELAIPRLYTTWTATTINIAPPAEQDLLPPSKGKKQKQQEIQANIESSMKNWGKFAQRNVWWSML